MNEFFKHTLAKQNGNFSTAICTDNIKYAKLFQVRRLADVDYNIKFSLISERFSSLGCINVFFSYSYNSNTSGHVYSFTIDKEIDGISLVMVNGTTDYEFYIKCNINDKVKGVIESCSNPERFLLYKNSRFSESVSSSIFPNVLNSSKIGVITLSNSWALDTNMENKLIIKNGMVNLNMTLTSGVTSNGLTIGNIPSGYRPSKTLRFECLFQNTDDTLGRGYIQLYNNGNFQIFGVTGNKFLTANVTYCI